MTLTYPQAEMDLLLKSRASLPMTSLPPEANLLTDVGSIAVGDVMMLDRVTLATDLSYTTITTPTTAALGTGIFCVVTSLLSGAGAINTLVRVQFYGEVSANLAVNAGIGSVFTAADALKTVTTTATAGAKILGWTKETGTGVKKVYFDGRGINSNNSILSGVREVLIGHDEIYVGTTTPAVTGTAELVGGSTPVVRTWNFADGADLIAWTTWIPPKSWNAGTITIKPIWSCATGSAAPVVWSFDAFAVSDQETLLGTVGTAVTSTDTANATANFALVGPATAAMTIAGTPAKNDVVMIRIMRTASAGGDTLAQTARLHGIVIAYTTDAPTDA